MQLKRSLSNSKLRLITATMTISLLGSSQNVYDTYNPHGSSWPSSSFTVGNSHNGYSGEYQLFYDGLNWESFCIANSWAMSYKIEPVSFPFTADCSTGDCGNSSSTTRNLNLPDPYDPTAWMSRALFNTGSIGDDADMSNTAMLASKFFTQNAPQVDARDVLPHTILKHTYYLHCGNQLNDPVIDSFSFIIDHTRGMTSRYPYTADNGGSFEYQHDIAIHAWVIYPAQPFLDSPPQGTNSMSTVNYFPYPDAHYFPGICSSPGSIIPDPNNANDQAQDADQFARPSPYSLRGFMLGDLSEEPFSGYDYTTSDPFDGISHTYFIDYDMDLKTINPAERIIYNPASVFITTPTTAPIIFPSGYTFQTVGAIYPTAAEVATWNPNTMVDPRKVHVHGSALHLTDNPDTEIDDAHSFYTVTENSMLVIEKCVTIWDAEIIVEDNATLEYWPDELYGNVILSIDPGATVIPHYGNSTVACPYVCTQADLYNDDQFHVYSNTSFTTTNLASIFTGSSPWSAVTGNTVRFSQALVVHSGYTLTVGAGVNLEFGPNAGIIVEEDANLIINGTSTSGCRIGPACQMEWKGIQVLGDRTQWQNTVTNTPQGYVELNYCTLEHAHDGITLGDYYTYGTEGGIVRAYNTVFRNNVRDVQFLSYRNFGSSNYTLNNISGFYDCEFRTTEYFYDPALNLDYGVTPSAGYAHISMYDVKNVQVKDCIFSNDIPLDYKPHLRGCGIFGIDAGLRLYASNPNSFEGLSDGVWMQSSGFSAGSVHVAGCTFDNNIHSIVMEGTVYSLIYDNDIDVPESMQFGYSSDEMSRGYDKPVGVYMLGATDFRIEDNNFNVGDNATQNATGSYCEFCSYNIVVHESAVANPFTSVAYGSGTVYHNIIDHASMGIQVQGNNGYNGSTYGLQVMCNDFEEIVNYDFILNGNNAVSCDLVNQGTCVPAHPELLAGNEFLSSCTSTPTNQVYADLTFLTNQNSPFDYNEMTTMSNDPQCYNINVLNCLSNSEFNPCSSRITTRAYLSPILSHYSAMTANHESVRSDLDDLIDGWKALGPEVWTNPPSFYSIYNGYWLSDSTLLSLFEPENRQYISDEDLVSLLIANSGLSPEVYAAAMNADPAIDSRYTDDLEEAQENGPSERILMEREWAEWVHQADLAANEITEYALRTDSLAEGITALLGAKYVGEMQNLFILQLAAREFEDAETTLGNILIEQDEEESSWTILAAISLEQQQDDRSWLSATEEEIEAADDIFSVDNERAISARVISTYYSRAVVARAPYPLHGEEESRLGHEPENSESPQVSQTIQVFPNPTSGFATVFISEDLAKDGTFLEITNPLGQVVDRIAVSGNAPIQLDLNQYADGMLYLRLMYDEACLASEKLLIIK